MPIFEYPESSKLFPRLLSKIIPTPPPSPLLPPNIEETKQAWGNVISENPKLLLPFAPKVDIGELGKALYGTAANILGSDVTMGMVSPLQIKAFHGSPYKFSKFESKAIGTGEGAQAFGYGHYLTESPEVAKSYAKIPIELVKARYGEAWSAVEVYKSGQKTEALTRMNNAILDMEHYIKKYKPSSSGPFETLENYKKIKEQMIDNTFEVPSNIYETTIHKGKQPSEYTFLEWDKPLKKDQMSKIEKQLMKEYPGQKYFFDTRQYELVQGSPRYGKTLINGRDTYDRIGSYLDGNRVLPIKQRDKLTSEFLQRAGISGIKYPTGSLSGMKPTGEYNYVVFNPEDITIEKLIPKKFGGTVTPIVPRGVLEEENPYLKLLHPDITEIESTETNPYLGIRR